MLGKGIAARKEVGELFDVVFCALCYVAFSLAGGRTMCVRVGVE